MHCCCECGGGTIQLMQFISELLSFDRVRANELLNFQCALIKLIDPANQQRDSEEVLLVERGMALN